MLTNGADFATNFETVPIANRWYLVHTVRHGNTQIFLPDFADQCQSVVVSVGGVYSELIFFRSIGLPLSLGDVKYIVY